MLAGAVLLPAILGGVTLLLLRPRGPAEGHGARSRWRGATRSSRSSRSRSSVLAVAGTIRKLDSLAIAQDAHADRRPPGSVRRPRRHARRHARAGGLVEGRAPDRRPDDARAAPRPGRGARHRRARAGPAGRAARPGGEGSVYPSDLALTGSKDAVPKARALVARDVPSNDAWFTTTKEAQKVEDQLAALERRTRDARGPAARARPRSAQPRRSTRRRSRCSTGAGCSSRCAPRQTSATPWSSRRRGQSPRRRPARPSDRRGPVLAALSAVDIVLTAVLSRDRRRERCSRGRRDAGGLRAAALSRARRRRGAPRRARPRRGRAARTGPDLFVLGVHLVRLDRLELRRQRLEQVVGRVVDRAVAGCRGALRPACRSSGRWWGPGRPRWGRADPGAAPSRVAAASRKPATASPNRKPRLGGAGTGVTPASAD